MEERKELFETYGFDLLKIVDDAKENGNTKFAEVIEKQIANVQVCYDMIAKKYTATANTDYWNIDAEYLQEALK